MSVDGVIFILISCMRMLIQLALVINLELCLNSEVTVSSSVKEFLHA